MTRITNGEQIALALQARLQRLNKQKKASVDSKNAERVDAKTTDSSDPLKELLDEGGVIDNALINKVVGYLLQDQFGDDFAQDHRFKSIVSRVSTIISQDESSSELVKQALNDLRNG